MFFWRSRGSSGSPKFWFFITSISFFEGKIISFFSSFIVFFSEILLSDDSREEAFFSSSIFSSVFLLSTSFYWFLTSLTYENCEVNDKLLSILLFLGTFFPSEIFLFSEKIENSLSPDSSINTPGPCFISFFHSPINTAPFA